MTARPLLGGPSAASHGIRLALTGRLGPRAGTDCDRRAGRSAVTGALPLLGALYAAAHGIRLALAWHPRPVTSSPPAPVTVLQPILSGDPAMGRVGGEL